MVSEEQKKEYQNYVKEITPTHNTPRNIFRAFWTGGTVCVIGQILSVFFEKMGMGKEAAGTWTSIALVLAAIIDLNIVVDVGLVTGVTPAIIPIGSAIST